MILDPRLQAAAQSAVQAVMLKVKGVRACVVSTEDGFEVASQVENTAEISRLSAMASSMAALGAIAGDENRLGACQSVVIEAAQGNIVMMQARRSDVSFVLSVVAGPDAIMGQILYYARTVSRGLEQV